MNAHGCDVSRWQYPCNYELGKNRGLRFAIIRASIGDYYSDPRLRELWNGYKAQGFLVSAYLVTAPRDPSLTRQINAHAHLDHFFNTVTGLVPDFPWWVDAELERGETKTVITNLHKGVVNGLFNASGKYPVVYTRQTWWDTWVNADPLWGQCDLHAARYANWLTSPWSDGACKFRDWDDWKFWQYTSHADGPYFGFASLNGDLDYFNGNEGDLYGYAGLPQPVTYEEKVDILWREAGLHGWNMEG